jgi:quinolinate synthase
MIPASTREKIERLKEERNAVILVHNYQRPEVQEIADYLGDSLGLSQEAAKIDADVIVFCGVKFMAETAKILSPKKTVLMPEIGAGCPMANMITVEGIRSLRVKHPNARAVAYVNTNADVKAEVDFCCTSSNAVKVVESLESDEVIFVPDKYLGHFVSTQVEKEMILWNGYCPTHVKIQPEDIIKLKKKHPKAEVLVHPECTPQVIKVANRALSTDGIIRRANLSKAKEFIIGTEVGILHRLRKENPDKEFYPASELAVCPNMKLTTLNKVLWSLQEMKHGITVPDKIAKKARKSIERMLEIV